MAAPFSVWRQTDISSVNGVAPRTGTHQVATEQAIRVLDRAALPGAVRVAEVGVEADGVRDRLVPSELAAVVVGDGAPRSGRQSAQFCGDRFCGEVGVFAMQTTGER